MRRPREFTETLIPVLLLIIAGFVFIGVWRLPDLATADLVGPKIYPGVLAVLLAILSGLLLVGAAPPHGGDASIKLPGIVRRLLPLLLFSALYVLALPWLGFMIATTALLTACFSLLGERRQWLNLVIAAGCTLMTYLLFATLLGTQLVAFPG